MTAFQIANRRLARLDAVEKIPRVPSVIFHGLAGFVLDGLGPELALLGLRLGLGSTDWVTRWQHARDDIVRRHFGIREDLEAGAGHGHRAMSAVQHEAAHPLDRKSVV